MKNISGAVSLSKTPKGKRTSKKKNEEWKTKIHPISCSLSWARMPQSTNRQWSWRFFPFLQAVVVQLDLFIWSVLEPQTEEGQSQTLHIHPWPEKATRNHKEQKHLSDLFCWCFATFCPSQKGSQLTKKWSRAALMGKSFLQFQGSGLWDGVNSSPCWKNDILVLDMLFIDAYWCLFLLVCIHFTSVEIVIYPLIFVQRSCWPLEMTVASWFDHLATSPASFSVGPQDKTSAIGCYSNWLVGSWQYLHVLAICQKQLNEKGQPTADKQQPHRSLWWWKCEDDLNSSAASPMRIWYFGWPQGDNKTTILLKK